MNADSEKKVLYKWIISTGLVLLLCFFVDIFVLSDTLLTPYEELHPTALPVKDIATGVYYIKDKKTGKTYTLDKNKKLLCYDFENKKIKSLDKETEKIKLTSRGIVYQHPPISPLYAFYLPCFSLRLLLPITIIVGFLFFLFRFIKSDEKIGIKLLFLFLFTIFIRASFAWVRHDFSQMGVELLRYDGESVLFDVPLITNVFEFLKIYPDIMMKLSMNGSHYPPGFALFLKVVAEITGIGGGMEAIKANINIIGWIIVIIGSTSIFPLYLLIKEFFDKNTAVIGVIVFIFIPNTIIYGAVSLSAIFVMLALWPVWLLVKADKDGPVCSVLAGLLLGVAIFFNFSAIPVGLIMTLFILFKMLQSKENSSKYLKISAWAAIGFFSFVLFFYSVFGFNLIQCFFTAKKLEMQFMNYVAGRYHNKSFFDLYFYAVWGNYLAFCIYAGFHNIALFLHNVKNVVSGGIKNLSNFSIFSISTFVFIVISGLVYHMETERIWQFVSAFLAVVIAGELRKMPSDFLRKRILLALLTISALLTVIFESLLFTLW